MTIDYADFTRASNLLHMVQGAALLLLGASQVYAAEHKGRGFVLAAAGLLAASGAVMIGVMLAVPGHWSFGQLSAALTIRRGFYLFVALACIFSAAGMSLLTREALGRKGGSWHAVFLGLLAFAGIVYFLAASRVSEEAWRRVMVWHSAMGATLLLAVAAGAADMFFPRRALRMSWAVLLIMTGLQLITYKESEQAFGVKMITMESVSKSQTPSSP